MTYPFHGHDNGLVISGPDTGFAERPMTAAERLARDPALKIAKDIYRHANYAGVCYVELWRIIADTFESHIKALEDQRDDLYSQVHRLEKLAEQTPLENYIGSLGSGNPQPAPQWCATCGGLLIAGACSCARGQDQP